MQIWNLPIPQLVLGGSHYAVIATFHWCLILLSSYHSIHTFANSNVSMHFLICFSNFLVGKWHCLPCKAWVNLFLKKHLPWQVGDKLEEKALTSPKNYMWKYLFLSLILLLRGPWPWPWHIIRKAGSTNSCSGRLRYPTLNINKELHLKNSLHTMPQGLRISFKASLLF